MKRLIPVLLAVAAWFAPCLVYAQASPSYGGANGAQLPTHANCYAKGDGTCTPAAGLVFAEATNRSGTITTGGVAQDLMAANANRQGWEFQNQSTDNCYIRSKGPNGTTVASADQNSILIYPGQYFSPAHISLYAYSVICPTTGDIFYSREW